MTTSFWRKRALGVATCLTCLCILGEARPRAQNPQFRSSVDLVTLDVTVLDRAGNPVTGLAKEDFVVLENGKPQTVSTFVAVAAPTPPPDRAVWEKTVTTEVIENRGAEERLLVLVIDDATLPLDPWMIQATRTAAQTFIEGLGPTDKTAVVFTGNNRSAQDFTSDKALLLAAANKVRPGMAAAGYNQKQIPGALAVAGPIGEASDLYYYLSSVNTLSRVADYLADVPLRKKAIVWLGIGIPLNTDALAQITLTTPGSSMMAEEANRSMWTAMRRTIDRAQRGNVAIFGISPAGLDGIDNYSRAHRSNPLPKGSSSMNRYKPSQGIPADVRSSRPTM
jgi:VWFA-related protein